MVIIRVKNISLQKCQYTHILSIIRYHLYFKFKNTKVKHKNFLNSFLGVPFSNPIVRNKIIPPGQKRNVIVEGSNIPNIFENQC